MPDLIITSLGSVFVEAFGREMKRCKWCLCVSLVCHRRVSQKGATREGV